MLRRFAFLVLLALATPVLAQDYATDRGSYLLGGTVGFTSQGGELFSGGSDDRLTTIEINPTFGYFVTPGLAIGGAMRFEQLSQGDIAQTTVSVGPSLAYYFGTATSTTFPFLAANVGYSSVSFDAGDFGSDGINGYEFGGTFGVSHLIARNVALTGAAFYLSQTFSEDGESASGDTFGFRGGVTAFIF